MTWSPSVSLDQVIVVAGVGQLALVLASLAIPRVLGWHRELMHLRPLTRQVFWTYAGYIWGTNLSFGLVSVIGPGWLLDRSPLAGAVTAFIATYWTARLVLQLAYFDRSDVPAGWLPRLGEPALVGLFVLLAATYGTAALANLSGV